MEGKVWKSSTLGALLAAASLGQCHAAGAAPPTFKVTPGTVYVPAYVEDSAFTYEWNAPGHSSLDLQSSINADPWQPTPPLNIPASGHYSDRIDAGTTYSFRFLPHGDPSNVLGTVTVTGVVAPSPVFAANPAHLVTNGSAADSLISWNALGYDSIDWCGNINDEGWHCGLLTTAGSGSTTVSVPAGTTYRWRFYPHGSPNQGAAYQLLGELAVDCISASSPTFTANPAHIIVPAEGPDGATIVTWNAGAHAQIDWCGKVDDGPWTWSGLSTPPIGSSPVIVPVGRTYGYRFYAPGTATGCQQSSALGELTVDATH